ncbi:hypothetical protein VPHD479_0365 [Vibrio phage D479]
MNLLKVVKNLFQLDKDHRGRNIASVCYRLAAHRDGSPYDWSYIRADRLYENTRNGQKVRDHELTRMD